VTDTALFEAQLDSLLTTNQELPSLPAMVLQVQRALGDENRGVSDLGRLIEQDPALTTRLLGMANSAAFTRGARITSVAAAVDRLGLKHVRSVCMAVGVIRAFQGVGESLDHARYWRHSAAVGLVAELLAKSCSRAAQVDGADAYVAGLLHDVGLLILDQFFPESFTEIKAAVEAEMTGRWHPERALLRMDHGQLGARFLGRWQLADAVAAAVADHHGAIEAVAAVGPLGQLVWAAEALCSTTGLELPEEGAAEVSPEEVFDRLGVDPADREGLVAEVGRIGEQALLMVA
jgi:putative nucleotidyltransferase with HDIG domain